ncbi:protease complex subunit PrcB family protein [Flavobacterium sp. NKUCC04_CG]|uniref:protease complex subunit PrcB family protein n=1 Tax=Flavobacterium sp. NKUCC04_CG TaxID=2842121 RepID=UPI001C5A7174|nr:protease complex subunit PrcB family protein [Flavobacterium sp. NKUCC04_CG]MBW3520262.1 protease complex subunit PrcB family protein [Flavobacterium sp. NKUCC04_CG]
MKKLIVFAWLFLVGVACSSDDNKIEKPFEPRQLEMETILQGNDCRHYDISTERTFIVWEDRDSWELFKIDFNRFIPDFEATILNEWVVDFNSEMVIVVLDQQRLYGGYSIDVVHVEEDVLNVVVNIDQVLKGGINAVLTRPYHIVKIPKLGKPVVFEEL